MNPQNRETLKKYFETNDRPTQGQFSDLIDSFVNIEELMLALEGLATEATVSQILSALSGITDGLATEVTLQELLEVLASIDLNTDALETSLSDLNNSVATETTLSEIKTHVSGISSLATESTLSNVKDNLESIKDNGLKIQDKDGFAIDPATEDTLLTIDGHLVDLLTGLESILTELDVLSAEDFATETTLNAVKTAVEAIQTNTNAQPTLITYIDDTTTTNKVYIGKAVPSSLLADPVWQIKVLDSTGTYLQIKWADGNANFDNVWNNRASLSYS